MSAGLLGQQAITVQESQLGGRRLVGTSKGGMCFEYLTLTFFLPMTPSFLLAEVCLGFWQVYLPNIEENITKGLSSVNLFFGDLGKSEKRGMIGGEKRGVSPQDGCDGRMTLEFFV